MPNSSSTIYNKPVINRYSKILYVDVNTAYGLNADNLLLKNVAAIINELYNLLFTLLGERHFEPSFGIGLESLIFDLPTTIVEYLTQNLIYDAVTKFMSNVTVDLRNTSVTPLDNQEGFMVTIAFSINSVDNATNLTADFLFPST